MISKREPVKRETLVLVKKMGLRSKAGQRCDIKAGTLNVLRVWHLVASVRSGTD